MDKNQFISILTRYPGTSLREAEEIISLKSAYPYSQLLHALSARVTKDHGMDNQQAELQIAAVHAADRAVLKEIITAAPREHVMAETVTPATTTNGEDKPIEVTEQREEDTQPVEKAPYYASSSDDVAGEVMRDLMELSQRKQNFEMLLVDYGDVKIKPAVKEIPVSREQTPTEKEAPKENIKSKKARIIEAAKALQAASAADDAKPSEEQPRVSGGKKRKRDNQDELLEEIRSSKEEITPAGEKQKEQIEVINQFIKIQPSISNSKDRPLPPAAGDLNPIKSGEFGDNVISETLVDILIKQGKKDKAIEVLKKLIWKYPQKKTYFASQIEELKK